MINAPIPSLLSLVPTAIAGGSLRVAGGLAVSAFAWVAAATATPDAPTYEQVVKQEEPHYVIEALPPPPSGDYLETGCLLPLPGDRMAVGTRRGMILIINNASSPDVSKITWTVFARGLVEPLGMQWRDGSLWVVQKPEITKLTDTDGDGRADRFDTITDRWGFNGDYHEFTFMAPEPEADGSAFLTLCLTGSFNSNDLFRGWGLKVYPDGKVVPVVSGIRSPGGMGHDMEGRCYYSDNQGPRNGSSCLKHLKLGSFQGHQAGLKWYDQAPNMGPKPVEPLEGVRIEAERKRIPQFVPPAVVFPHGNLGQSPSGIICDRSAGKFGPFAGHMLVAEQFSSQIQRVVLEEVNGVMQGAVIPFKSGFITGNIALAQTAEGMIYTGGTKRGWPCKGPQSYGLERLRYTGKAPFEIDRMTVTPDGFEVSFTAPVGPEAAKVESYAMSGWTYIYQSKYGSPKVDPITPTVTAAALSADGRKVRLTVNGWQQGHVHELALPGVRSQAGQPLLHPIAYYTLNEIPKAK